MTVDKTPQYIKLDERNHVEKPFLDQLAGLGWQVIDLEYPLQHRFKGPALKRQHPVNRLTPPPGVHVAQRIFQSFV